MYVHTHTHTHTQTRMRWRKMPARSEAEQRRSYFVRMRGIDFLRIAGSRDTRACHVGPCSVLSFLFLYFDHIHIPVPLLLKPDRYGFNPLLYQSIWQGLRNINYWKGENFFCCFFFNQTKNIFLKKRRGKRAGWRRKMKRERERERENYVKEWVGEISVFLV